MALNKTVLVALVSCVSIVGVLCCVHQSIKSVGSLFNANIWWWFGYINIS